MKVNLVVIFLLGLLVGIVLSYSPSVRTPAFASSPSSAYEYQVVRFTGMMEAAMTKQMNELAGAGWEYVGIVQCRGESPNITYVAVRRIRQ